MLAALLEKKSSMARVEVSECVSESVSRSVHRHHQHRRHRPPPTTTAHHRHHHHHPPIPTQPEGPEAEDEFENGDLGGDASGAGGVGGGVGGGGGGEGGARSGKSLFQTLSRKKSMMNELGGGQVRYV